MSARHWCFTSFEEELQYDEESMVYMVYGREVCPTTGKRHLQGFVSFKTKRKLGAVKKYLRDNKAHVEVSRGTIQQASDYCKKDGDFVEFGEKPKEKNVAGGEARKRQYDDAWESAKSGEYESIESSIKLHCWHNIVKIHAHYQSRKVIPDMERGSIVGTWIVGDSNVGKSTFARTICELRGFTLYNKTLNKWWDTYDGEQVVLVEDIEQEHAKFMSHHLKIWGDLFPFPAEIKGCMTKLRPLHVIVTSQYDVNEIWPMDVKIQEAINRRYFKVHAHSREDFDRVTWPRNSTLHPDGFPRKEIPSSSSTEITS